MILSPLPLAFEAQEPCSSLKVLPSMRTSSSSSKRFPPYPALPLFQSNPLPPLFEPKRGALDQPYKGLETHLSINNLFIYYLLLFGQWPTFNPGQLSSTLTSIISMCTPLFTSIFMHASFERHFYLYLKQKLEIHPKSHW